MSYRNSQHHQASARYYEDVARSSTLEPTAPEFHPSTSYSSNNGRGAVRRPWSGGQRGYNYNRRGGGSYRTGRSNTTSWRAQEPADQEAKPKKFHQGFKKKIHTKVDAASQRERLLQMIEGRILECLICCEVINKTSSIWSCQQCYHIFHLNCTISWATSSQIKEGWRCPACQNLSRDPPKYYKCFCQKVLEPKFDPAITPHSCGEVCLKKGRTCEHKCTILCHPGPCPECTVQIERTCGCGRTRKMVMCCSELKIPCEQTCGKTLNCQSHTCQETCHLGDCKTCDEQLHLTCFCGKSEKMTVCSQDNHVDKKFFCGETCGRRLNCQNHFCQDKCHEGDCQDCDRSVDKITTCPCGKTLLEKKRKSCLDPIACCSKTCGKELKCGQPAMPHYCKEGCHEGACPACTLTTKVKCRCGHMDRIIDCKHLVSKADDARCEKKCTKKRLCWRHKCNQLCCIEVEHICPLPCNKKLSCGQHLCPLTCHQGPCPGCLETSFEELYCECRSTFLYPPIPCGTKPPVCKEDCSRTRSCGHAPNHSCHTGACPPCTVLCKRWCFGRHEQRSAIPCHQEAFSCGLSCLKDMSCGRHKCIKPCHGGDCPQPCKQPCQTPRILCNHPCNKPCHDPPCEASVCKTNVAVTCSCGLLKDTKRCQDLTHEFRMLEMLQFKDNEKVDLEKLKKPSVLKVLDCNEECKVFERNRRLAMGLQIRNPDLSQKLTPRYSEFLRSWAKKDAHFCQKVHDKLSELVQLAKESKQKSRSYSFESMNYDKRHFVHEYCEHFGCESAAYDQEPKRNVVATAIKDKSWLPSMSLLEVIQRENGQRKVPLPSLGKGSSGKSETTSLKLPQRPRAASPPL